jgi:hypothetical protein
LPLGVECMVNIDIIVESNSRGMYACEKKKRFIIFVGSNLFHVHAKCGN